VSLVRVSRRRRNALAALLALAAGAASPAQGGMTWIVDQANGAGAHFTDIPPAVAAAADGDTILIRSGSYSGFATGKALTVLGEGAVAIRGTVAPPATAQVEIVGEHVAIPFLQNALERTTFSFQVPPGTAWLGWPVAVQAGHFYQSNGQAELSNAAVVALF
jgi:hypothetical protein